MQMHKMVLRSWSVASPLSVPQTAFPIRPRGGIGGSSSTCRGQVQVSGGILRGLDGSAIPPKAPPATYGTLAVVLVKIRRVPNWFETVTTSATYFP